LYCLEIFGNAQNQMINKFYPLLTDGNFLYIIAKKIVIEKIVPETLAELHQTKTIEKRANLVSEPRMNEQGSECKESLQCSKQLPAIERSAGKSAKKRSIQEIKDESSDALDKSSDKYRSSKFA